MGGTGTGTLAHHPVDLGEQPARRRGDLAGTGEAAHPVTCGAVGPADELSGDIEHHRITVVGGEETHPVDDAVRGVRQPEQGVHHGGAQRVRRIGGRQVHRSDTGQFRQVSRISGAAGEGGGQGRRQGQTTQGGNADKVGGVDERDRVLQGLRHQRRPHHPAVAGVAAHRLLTQLLRQPVGQLADCRTTGDETASSQIGGGIRRPAGLGHRVQHRGGRRRRIGDVDGADQQ